MQRMLIPGTLLQWQRLHLAALDVLDLALLSAADLGRQRLVALRLQVRPSWPRQLLGAARLLVVCLLGKILYPRSNDTQSTAVPSISLAHHERRHESTTTKHSDSKTST